MRAIRSDIKITPFGGAVPILKKIKEFGIPQLIRSSLGTRKKQAKFSYEDVLISWILTILCGGRRLDHITKLKKKLNIIPGLKIPSHDTLGLVFKKLATETQTKRNITKDKKARITYSESNLNPVLNELLIKATKRIGILKEGKKYTLHIDSTIIETKCLDAKYTYEKMYGFNPMICLIDDLPVYISMRNGNVTPQYEIALCLQQCLDLLEKHNIKIGTVISDNAGYNIEMLKLLDKRNINFVIRPKFRFKDKPINDALQSCKEWKKTEIKTFNSVWDCEIGEMPYLMHKAEKNYRIVAVRFPTLTTIKKNETPDERLQREAKEGKMKNLRERKVLKPRRNAGRTKMKGKHYQGYEYKFFFTNDHSMPLEEVVKTFHKRGGEERRFEWMKNDFGWALPPFQRMNQNTVFFIAAALANNIFRGVIHLFKKDIPQLRKNARLPEIQFIFINVACRYLNGTYIFYNTDIAFEKIA